MDDRRGYLDVKGRGPLRRDPAPLKLMRTLLSRTQGLILLTATPMQVHPIEVGLAGLARSALEWTAAEFLDFFKEARQTSPPAEALDRTAVVSAVERRYGKVSPDAIQRLTGLSRLRASALLRALRDEASIPRRRLETAERRAAVRVMLAHTPIRHLTPGTPASCRVSTPRPACCRAPSRIGGCRTVS